MSILRSAGKKTIETDPVLTNIVLVGESKLNEDNIDAACLGKILHNFDTYPECRLFVIVGLEFSDMKELQNLKYNVWKVSLNSNIQDLHYDLEPAFPLNPEIQKNVILIGLVAIASGPIGHFLRGIRNLL